MLPGVVRYALGPARTFALAAAVTVVAVHLLPEAVSSLGVVAFGALALGLVVPTLGERLAVRVMRARGGALERGTVAVHVSFAGLLVHQIGDGMGLWVFAGGARPSLDVALALGAHTVPLTMLVVLAPLSAGHRGLAFARAGALALATCVGVLLGVLVPAGMLETVEPWTAAIVAGLLLHVLWHDVRRNAPQTGRARAVDLLAAAAGVALAGLGAGTQEPTAHGDVLAGAQARLGAAIADLALDVAPVLLLGLVIGAVVQVVGGRISDRWLRGGGTLSQAVRGAVLGAPSPICACGAIPVARSLRARGASVALAVAFLVATPGLGADTFALTFRLFDAQVAVIRVVGAIIVAVVGAVVVSRFARPAGESRRARPVVELDAVTGRVAVRLLRALSELSRHTGPWIVVGVVAAAYADVLVGPGQLAPYARSGVDVLLVSVLVIPGYVCASSATPLAAVLVAKGLSPGAAIVGLVLGPALNITTLGFLGRGHGRRATALGLGAMLLVGWGLAFAVNAWLPATPAMLAVGDPARAHGWLALGSAGVLGVWLLVDVWRRGIRGWLAALADGSDPAPAHDASNADAEHVHGPGCGHSHALTPPPRVLRSRSQGRVT